MYLAPTHGKGQGNNGTPLPTLSLKGRGRRGKAPPGPYGSVLDKPGGEVESSLDPPFADSPNKIADGGSLIR